MWSGCGFGRTFECLSVYLISLSSRFSDSDMPSSFSVNLIDEKIPKCYLRLQTAIQSLLENHPTKPLYKRDAFWWVWSID